MTRKILYVLVFVSLSAGPVANASRLTADNCITVSNNPFIQDNCHRRALRMHDCRMTDTDGQLTVSSSALKELTGRTALTARVDDPYQITYNEATISSHILRFSRLVRGMVELASRDGRLIGVVKTEIYVNKDSSGSQYIRLTCQ